MEELIMNDDIRGIINNHDLVLEYFLNKENTEITDKFKNSKNTKIKSILTKILFDQKITLEEFNQHFFNHIYQVNVIRSFHFLNILRNAKLSIHQANNIYLQRLEKEIELHIQDLRLEDEGLKNLLHNLINKENNNE